MRWISGFSAGGGGAGAHRLGIRVGKGQHVIPGGFQQLGQFGRAGIQQRLVIVDLQQDHQHVGGGGGDFVTAPAGHCLADAHQQRPDVGPVIVIPDLLGLFAHGGLQFAVSALLQDLQLIHAAQRVKIHEVIVSTDYRVVHKFGHNPGDVGGDGRRVKVLHDADPLVALLDIEAAQIFVAADGVADALLHMCLAEG